MKYLNSSLIRAVAAVIAVASPQKEKGLNPKQYPPAAHRTRSSLVTINELRSHKRRAKEGHPHQLQDVTQYQDPGIFCKYQQGHKRMIAGKYQEKRTDIM